MNKRILAIASLLLTLTACAPTSSNTVKIGVITPLTGDAAALGSDMSNGVKLAVDQLNAKGGIGGKKIDLIVEDGRCTGADAASAAQKLVNADKVVAIIGGLCSGETLAAAPITEAGKVILISPTSSSPDVTNAGEYVFRNYPSDALKTKAMAKIFVDRGYKNVAILSENTDFSTGFRDSLKKDFKGTFVFDEVVEPGTKDFRSLMTRLKSLKFDVFVVNSNSDTVDAVMIQQFRDAGLTQPAISQDTADSKVVGEVAKDAAEGLQMVNIATAGEGTSFEKEFVAKFGQPQSSISWGAYPYDAMMVVAQVMTDKGMDGQSIHDGLLAIQNYKGIVGNFHFDKNGDVVGIPFVLKEIKEGIPTEVSKIEL